MRYCKFTRRIDETELGCAGIAILHGVARKAAMRRVENAKQTAAEEIKASAKVIRKRIASYEQQFDAFGYNCPLGVQFERTVDRGFPTINRFVDTLLLCEMTTGILMGAQDYGRMQGPLLFDTTHSAETYEGMRAKHACKEGEIVVRDSNGIVASYYQGSDKRTAITRQTSDVIFFSFGAKGVPAAEVEAALIKAVELLGPAAEETALEMLC